MEGDIGQAIKGEVKDFIKNPKIGLGIKDVSKIHPEDLATMKDFTDLINGAYKPSEKVAAQLRLDAQRIAENYGIGSTETDKVLSNKFGKVLDANPNFLKNRVVKLKVKEVK